MRNARSIGVRRRAKLPRHKTLSRRQSCDARARSRSMLRASGGGSGGGGVKQRRARTRDG
eukprot:5966390-Pleurochrysis_carterae.AAC.1